MAYRNPLAWNRNLKPGLFVANPNAELPPPDMGLHIGLYDGSLAGFDWLGEENNTGFTYSDLELDRMIAELNELGYGDMGMGQSSGMGCDYPQRTMHVRVWRTHSK